MTTSKLSLGDRYSDVAVILLTLIAQIAGWFYMGSVESRSLPFETEGVQLSVPAGWIQSEPGGEVLVQVRERASSGFQTLYTLSRQPLTAEGGLNDVVSLLTIQYGQDLTAFRVLNQQAVTVDGREAYQVEYAYVESDPNVARADLPVVVRGLDTIFLDGDKAFIASYRASEAEYEGGLAAFYRFLHSIKF